MVDRSKDLEFSFNRKILQVLAFKQTLSNARLLYINSYSKEFSTTPNFHTLPSMLWRQKLLKAQIKTREQILKPDGDEGPEVVDRTRAALRWPRKSCYS